MENRMRPMQMVEWDVIPVTDSDPLEFAKNLKVALQRLSDEGFSIVSQMQRGSALVITAHRVRMEEASVGLGAGRQVARVGDAVRVPGTPLLQPRPALGDLKEEVLYYFKEGEEQKRQVFPSMLEALRMLLTHLAGDNVLPIRIVATTATYFDPPVFKELLRLFAEELREDRPHQPE